MSNKPPSSKRWLAFDAEDNPLRVPTNFRGTREEFAALVHDLQPHHCSYPTGYPIDSETGKPCRRSAENGGKLCVLHASDDMIGAMFGRNVPHNLLNRLKSAVSTRDKWSIDTEIGFVVARLSMLAEQLSTGESGKLWADLKTDCDAAQKIKSDFVAAHRAGDAEKTGMAIQSLFRVVQQICETVAEGASDKDQWDEICLMLDRSVAYKAADAKAHRDRNLMIPADHAIGLFLQLGEKTKEFIPTQDGRIQFVQWLAEKLKIFGPSLSRVHAEAIERQEREARNQAMIRGEADIDGTVIPAGLSSLKSQINRSISDKQKPTKRDEGESESVIDNAGTIDNGGGDDSKL